MRSENSSENSDGASTELPPLAWKNNLWLFLATVASVFWTGMQTTNGLSLKNGLQFTGALLGILIAHEAGHFIAARIHRVDASLPFFIPLPYISLFGTMGAVIRMRGNIATRKALLDIGASGPLVGLVVAIPLYIWGVAHSKVIPTDGATGMQLGESLLSRTIEHRFGPVVPPGMDLQLSPVAFAAWAGFFITMINLLPIGQLDGGHVAYSLFGPRQDRIATYVHRSLLAFFFVSLASFLFRDLRAGFGFVRIGRHVGNAMPWLFFFEFLAVLGTLSSPRDRRDRESDGELSILTRVVAVLGLAVLAAIGDEVNSGLLWISWFVGLGWLLAMEVRGGALRAHALFEHPATGSEPLGWGRAAIAVLTLAMFALLFMPAPLPLE